MVGIRRVGGGDYSVGVRGVGAAIIQGRRLFQIIPPKRGDYSRGAINRGAAIIRGNTLSENKNSCFTYPRIAMGREC